MSSIKQSYYYDLKRLKRKELYYFLAGFVDGEGSFNVSVVPHPSTKFRLIVNPKFQVYQHEKHPEILEIFQEVFQTGSIHKKSGSNVLVYEIASRKTLQEKVIPFFKKYPLATKREALNGLAQIVELMNCGAHKTRIGILEIIDIAHRMNQQGKGQKWSKDQLINHMDLTESSETTRRTPTNGDDIVQTFKR